MTAGKIFLDGKMVKATAALVHALTPGVVEGEGAFETMRAAHAKAADVDEHLARLAKGLKLLKMRAPYSQTELARLLDRTVRANGSRQSRIRVSVWRQGRRVRVAIVCRPFSGYAEAQYKKGFKAIVSTVKRPRTRFAHVKSLDYGVFRRAALEAGRAKCDEAILLNSRGEVVEGSRSNVFFVKRGVLYTPAVRCGALNGITRRQVIRCAREGGIPFRAVAADVRRLLRADEAFVTNSLIGIMPLTVVDGRPVGSGRVGPVTRKLLSAHRKDAHSSCPVLCKSV